MVSLRASEISITVRRISLFEVHKSLRAVVSSITVYSMEPKSFNMMIKAISLFRNTRTAVWMVSAGIIRR
jgi:hypothetical protein